MCSSTNSAELCHKIATLGCVPRKGLYPKAQSCEHHSSKVTPYTNYRLQNSNSFIVNTDSVLPRLYTDPPTISFWQWIMLTIMTDFHKFTLYQLLFRIVRICSGGPLSYASVYLTALSELNLNKHSRMERSLWLRQKDKRWFTIRYSCNI
jgi:hypothetical protein